jgi:hypothetical protein
MEIINELEEAQVQTLENMFPFRLLDFNDGFKYLGFNLKLNACKKRDYLW